MKRDAARTPTRSRSRKKAAAAPPPAEPLAEASAPVDAGETGEPSEKGNVGPLESVLSLALGVLFVVGALFPRSLKQLLLLGIGGGLVYRGMTKQCHVYAALGIDTAKEPLLKQINEKYVAPAAAS